jgi:hypothetical protein
VPAVEDALHATVRAAVTDTTIPVDISHPLKSLQRTHVWLNPSKVVTQEWDTTLTGTGSGQKRETIPIPIVLSVWGSSYIDIRDAAYALAGDIELALRSDFQLGIPDDVEFSTVETLEPDVVATDEGLEFVLQMIVSVTTRLGA